MDNGRTPCTVNNFTSLAKQGFFDNTTCHRLTTSTELGALQCGDPTTTGTGGPGYRFPNEYPTNQYRLTDPALKIPVLYPRGTLAMANSGPGTNGSQFFLVYKDSQLPPTYTVFGTIDSAGLATLDKVAAAGVADGSRTENNDGRDHHVGADPADPAACRRLIPAAGPRKLGTQAHGNGCHSASASLDVKPSAADQLAA